MKLFVAASLLLFGSAFLQAAEKPNPADYTIKVHLSASHLKSECVEKDCQNILSAEVILNGKKLELAGPAPMLSRTLRLIAPGDYQAKIIKDAHDDGGLLFNQEYGILLPDNIVWQCFTSGISE
jgi:hypothetical protein